MLASKTEDMLNTVVRQIAFYQFETLLHDERRKGELLPERIGELWLQVQTESLGPAFEFTPGIQRVLVLRAAFHPLAVLRLCVCVRRLPGERAVFGVPGRPSRLPGRNTWTCCAPAAPSGTRSCWRRLDWMPPIRLLEQGTGRDFRVH